MTNKDDNFMHNGDTLTETDIKVIHWAERILTPLIIAGLISLSTCAVTMNKKVAALQSHNDVEAVQMQTNVARVTETTEVVKRALANQQEMKQAIVKLETHQLNIREAISAIREQNKEILRKISELGR